MNEYCLFSFASPLPVTMADPCNHAYGITQILDLSFITYKEIEVYVNHVGCKMLLIVQWKDHTRQLHCFKTGLKQLRVVSSLNPSEIITQKISVLGHRD